MQRRTIVAGLSAAGLGAIGLAGVLKLHSGAEPMLAAKKTQPLIKVHKSPTCGCCEEWVTHLEKNGFKVEVFNEDNLEGIKQRLGVPFGKGSCHTGEVEGYLVEGHVPADDIRRLLAERPRAKGLVVPAMPIGSPGMEIAGVPAQEFTVELVKLDGETEAYSVHPGGSV
jgi:hypothetical protein